MTTYDIPGDVREMFSNREASYKIIDYKINDMDNIESLSFFIDMVGVEDEHIAVYDGTQAVLKHPDFDYMLVIDSGGLGDFFSHGYEVSIFNE